MRAPNCFPKWLYQLTLSPTVYESSGLPHVSPTLGAARVFNFSHPAMHAVVSYCGLDVPPLTTRSVECLCTCFFVVQIASSVNCLYHTFAHFLLDL